MMKLTPASIAAWEKVRRDNAEIFELFHRLWGKGKCAGDSYDKTEWQRLEKILEYLLAKEQ